MIKTVKQLNLVLRVIMELGIIFALGYWGIYEGQSMVSKILLGIGTPALFFGFWGLVDFRQAGVMSEPLRLLQELVISGLAAVALYLAGQHILGWALAVISIIHHTLVYLAGQTLLKH